MLRVVFALFANLVTLLFWPLIVWGRRRAAPSGGWLEVEIEGGIVEFARKQPIWVRRKPVFSLHGLRQAIEIMATDERVKGLVVTLKELRAGSAMATSLRNLLLEAKRTGKRVAVYLPNGSGTRDMYVASAADLVLLGPATFVAPLGFAVETPYVRRALDQLGVTPEVFARGRYKTAGESLMLEAMSAAQREQLEALLDVAWDVLLDALATGRSVDHARAAHWVENGPWSARTAVEQGLIDGIVYADELAKRLDTSAPDGAPRVPLLRYLRRKQRGFRPFARPPAIAVIELKGPIVSEHLGVAPVAAEDEVCEAIDRAREDPKFRAALVCIDSPGGSALASDRMLHALRRLAEKKAVVACMGDTAASGGYMVAVGAHAIIAQPTTITGSIGVVSARVIVKPLLDRLGIGVQVVKRGGRADMLSASRHLDSAERASVEGQLDEIYQAFLQAVADGRSRAVTEIEPLAGGRVWSGRDALRHGLVDRMGGFAEALDEVRRRLGPALAHLKPELISALRWRPRRRLVPRFLQALSETGVWWPVGALPLVALGLRRERAYLWCGCAETDLGG